jgi:hypothetical protein
MRIYPLLRASIYFSALIPSLFLYLANFLRLVIPTLAYK